MSDFLPLSRISSRKGFELGMATYARVGPEGKSFGLISWKVHLSHILRNDILAGGVAASGKKSLHENACMDPKVYSYATLTE